MNITIKKKQNIKEREEKGLMKVKGRIKKENKRNNTSCVSRYNNSIINPSRSSY